MAILWQTCYISDNYKYIDMGMTGHILDGNKYTLALPDTHLEAPRVKHAMHKGNLRVLGNTKNHPQGPWGLLPRMLIPLTAAGPLYTLAASFRVLWVHKIAIPPVL